MNDRFKFRVVDNRFWSDEKGKIHYDAEETYDYMRGDPQIQASCFGDLLDDSWIVEQCTGLKDKDGNLIYEGDILGGIFEGLYIGWCDECKQLNLKDQLGECMACLGDMHWCDLVEDDGKIEVIGNIHENKELLDER